MPYNGCMQCDHALTIGIKEVEDSCQREPLGGYILPNNAHYDDKVSPLELDVGLKNGSGGKRSGCCKCKDEGHLTIFVQLYTCPLHPRLEDLAVLKNVG